MKNVTESAPYKEKKQQIKSVETVLFISVLIGITLFAFLHFYNNYNDEVLYSERLSQMKEVTTQLFSGIEDVAKSRWKNAEMQSNYIMEEQPSDIEKLLDFMKKQEQLGGMETEKTSLIAVDSDGLYYTEEGQKGLLSEQRYLVSKPERVSFVSAGLLSDETRMVFLIQLSNPIIITNGDKEIKINYYGITQDMTELKPYFNCEAYGGNNGMYVTDEQGLKLFDGSEENTLKGYNLFGVLEEMEYLHGSSFEQTKKELDDTGVAHSNTVLNGEEYYYALYQMENAEWIMLFTVPSRFVALNTVELVNTSVRIILTFAIIMICICAVLIFVMMRRQQKSAVLLERKNSERLEVLNGELQNAVKEAEKSEEKAKEASKAKSDFLANMSHDIRTPMNAIVGITSLMEHEPGMTDKMETYIQKVQLSSRHLLGLINDILDMSRIESKEVQLNVEEVSLAEQIEQIDSIIRAQVNEHGQHFHIHVNEIVHEYLVCDGVRLRQICLNLLSNAVKYTPKGGDIVLELTEVPCEVADHARYVYTVTDNGYGMSPEFLEHIFEPFTRAENSMTNKVQGTGLGMAITKNIVDLMGGEIHVESQLGKGSRFEVVLTLPINRNVDYEIGISRVLLVSSENQLIRNVKAAMSESAVQFYAVSTEEEAAGWLTQESTDVILLAGCLKNKTLDETVSLLRKVAKNAVLIFCLDFASEEEVQEVLAGSDVDGMILRPFFLSNLAVAIARTRTASVSEEEESHILNGMNFLCAEDNELNAEILKELLHMYGATCTIYPDGEKIVEAFKSVKPDEYDAVLMDVQMPNMNGLEATRAIRSSENPLGKEIPIIAMTANAFSEDVQHCLGAGMDAHIAKPLDIDVLEKTLRGFSVGGGQAKPKNKMK